MGGIVSSIFGGGSAPSIDVADPIMPATYNETVEPVSKAVRDSEQKRLRARRAFSGTLLTGDDKGKGAGSLL